MSCCSLVVNEKKFNARYARLTFFTQFTKSGSNSNALSKKAVAYFRGFVKRKRWAGPSVCVTNHTSLSEQTTQRSCSRYDGWSQTIGRGFVRRVRLAEQVNSRSSDCTGASDEIVPRYKEITLYRLSTWENATHWWLYTRLHAIFCITSAVVPNLIDALGKASLVVVHISIANCSSFGTPERRVGIRAINDVFFYVCHS